MTEGSLPDRPRRRRVTVVVAARNERAHIDACLRALAAQADVDVEWDVVVVDNGSTDDTAARAAAHGVRVVREPRAGVARARNAGVRAATGEIVAFVDADCVPEPGWLRALVTGADDPTVGCFVGEIVPLASASPVARYVHERRVISQLHLLTRLPPGAATGSIAYRRSVFAAIGGFDESLPGGEDSDLFWRMVRTDRFRVRYAPRAVVAHAHPTRVGEHVRRSYREGVALGAFRRKHAADVPARLTSRPAVVVALLRILGGLALYPARVAGELRAGASRDRALLFPLLDKLTSIARVAGTLRELLAPARVPAHAYVADDAGAAAADAAPGVPAPRRRFVDALELDIDAAPLLASDAPDLRARVCRDLHALACGITAEFPGVSVVLTGSLFVGEGRVVPGADGPVLASDYDLFVVTPHPLHALPAVARRKLDRVMARIGPRAATADVGFVWRPLVRHRQTTLGGAVIAGSRAVCPLLPALPAPSGVSALLQAYGFLTAAPLDEGRYAELCAKALVRAARALLFTEARGRPRAEWMALASLDAVVDRMDAWRPILGGDAIDAIAGAADHLLGRAADGPRRADHAFHRDTLRAISLRMGPVESRIVAAKQVVWMLAEAHGRHSSRLGPRTVLEALQALADSWPTDGEPRPEYVSVQRLLARIATFNPHRFIYAARATPS